jgi:UDP-2,3-diacylglucosamine hydrolase
MIYFISDQHFGFSTRKESAQREMLFIKWLEQIRNDAEALYLMGDLFDFWFEYKTVVQKGYVRLLGKLAEIVDSGVPVYFFRGNHDIWAFDYLETEIGMKLYRKPVVEEKKGKRFYLEHGDGLGKGDKGYIFFKKIFESRFNQWLFRWIHPDIGNCLAWSWSGNSRLKCERKNKKHVAKEGITIDEADVKTRVANYCKEILKTEKIDYFVFGHYHQPIEYDLTPESKIFTLGDWIDHFSYGVFDGEKFELKRFEKNAV